MIRVFLAAAPLLLAVAARADDSGLRRVRVTKEAGAAPVVQTQPISGGSGGGDGGTAVVNAIQSLLSSSGGSDSSSGGSGLSTDDLKLDGFGVQGGLAAVWIFTNLKTSYHSTSAPDVQWSDKLTLAGGGYHGSLFFDSSGLSLGLEGGYFQDSRWRHVVSGSGGVHASERLDVNGGWVALCMRAYPVEWAFASATLGLGAYRIDTRIDTNAPSFQYDGIAGSRGIGLAGLGVGLTTPRRWRAGAGVEARWFYAGSGESQIETGGAIVSADLKARF